MRRLPAFALLLSLVLAARGGRVAAEEAPRAAFQVIVHPDNPLTVADRKLLADAFLKKVSRWPDDTPLRPVDLRPRLPARGAFSAAVLKRSTAAVKAYWQQRIFSGRGVPPPELAAEADVVSYVLANRGAVGYVSGDAPVRGAKTLRLQR